MLLKSSFHFWTFSWWFTDSNKKPKTHSDRLRRRTTQSKRVRWENTTRTRNYAHLFFQANIKSNFHLKAKMKKGRWIWFGGIRRSGPKHSGPFCLERIIIVVIWTRRFLGTSEKCPKKKTPPSEKTNSRVRPKQTFWTTREWVARPSRIKIWLQKTSSRVEKLVNYHLTVNLSLVLTFSTLYIYTNSGRGKSLSNSRDMADGLWKEKKRRRRRW